MRRRARTRTRACEGAPAAALEGVLRRKQRTLEAKLEAVGGLEGLQELIMDTPPVSPVRSCVSELSCARVRARAGSRSRAHATAPAHSQLRASPFTSGTIVRADHRAHAPHANACDVQPERLANAIAYKSLQGRCGLMVELASPTPHDGGSAVAAAAAAWEKAGADAIAVSIDAEVRRAPAPAAAPSRSRSHLRACRRLFAPAHAWPRGRCAC